MYIHTMKYYSATKKNEIMPLAATWMDLEIIILSEAKSEREGQKIYDVMGMWNLKYDRNELMNRNRCTVIEDTLMVTKRERK